MNSWIWLLVLPWLSACVSELEWDMEGQSYLVINGVVTNSFFAREIRITRQIGLELEGVRVPATGKVFKNGVFEADLQPFGFGVLRFPVSFRLEPGAEYELEIQLSSGATYRTRPQKVLPRLQIDSLSFELETLYAGTNISGQIQYDRFVNVYAHVDLSKLPKEQGAPFLRWQADEVWSFTEVQNPDDSLDVINTCYLTNGVDAFPSTLVDPAELQARPVRVKVMSRPLDQSFLQTHYMSAYLHTINEESYNFYLRAENLIQAGDLYDLVPGPVGGNVYNPLDETEEVLGFVDFSLADTARIRINYEDIKVVIQNECLAAEPCPDRVSLTGDRIGEPCKCYNCDEVFGLFSTIRPPYWGE